MKNKTLHKIAWIAGLLLCILAGCKTTQPNKGISKQPVTADSIAMASNYHYSVGSLSATYKMQLLGNQLFSLSGSIESITDKELMVSVKALLGIEVVRLYCTPEYAVLVDRLGKRICQVPFSELAPELGTDFYGLQGLLTNRMFDPDHNQYANFTLDVIDGNWQLVHNGKYQTEFLLQNGSFLQRSIIRSYSKGDYLMATYSGTNEIDGIIFPTQAKYVYYSKERSNSVDVTFQSVQFNTKKQLNWEMPTGYKNVTVAELQKQLLTL